MSILIKNKACTKGPVQYLQFSTRSKITNILMIFQVLETIQKVILLFNKRHNMGTVLMFKLHNIGTPIFFWYLLNYCYSSLIFCFSSFNFQFSIFIFLFSFFFLNFLFLIFFSFMFDSYVSFRGLRIAWFFNAPWI